MQSRVVARAIDGTLIKGTCLAVDPDQPSCQVRTATQSVDIPLASLKALFFVRDLVGSARRQEAQLIAPTDPRLEGKTLIEILFRDGERLLGLTETFPPQGQFYYVTPLDTGSNNLKMLVNQAAAVDVTVHDLREAAA